MSILFQPSKERQLLKRQIINFSAGPAKLPHKVLLQAQQELLDFRGSGVSVLEMSHRGAEFMKILQDTKAMMRELLNIPDNYEILFMQGGGSAQFSAVALNLMQRNKEHCSADYIVTGTWSAKAAKEASKFGKVREVFPKAAPYHAIPDPSTWQMDPQASYVYYCANETVHGVEFHSIPDTPEGVPLVCDMSSSFMSHPIEVSRYGVIFAGAQKNIGCAGATVVVVRKDLLNHAPPNVPVVLEYKIQADNSSMYNTPPTFGIYIIGLVMEWIKNKGGMEAMERRSQKKAQLLYDYMEKSNGFYKCPVARECRSNMNIVFRLRKEDTALESKFIKEAEVNGLKELKGHRVVGGLRASLYNAMRFVEVEHLLHFMQEFQEKYDQSE